MPRERPAYACTRCGKEVGRSNLAVKRVNFKEVGRDGLHLRTRAVAWLCMGPDGCMEKDPDWNLPSYISSPGNADTAPAKEFRETVDG